MSPKFFDPKLGDLVERYYLFFRYCGIVLNADPELPSQGLITILWISPKTEIIRYSFYDAINYFYIVKYE